MERMMKLGVLAVMLLGLLINVTGAAEMKTVVLMEYPVEPARTDMRQQILAELGQAGFQEDQNLKLVSFASQQQPDWAEQVTQLAPDVVIDYSGNTGVTAKLHELGMPTVSYWGAESYVDADGVPTANITGVYTTLPDMEYNSYKFLQKIAPLKEGQQVVFLDNPEILTVPKERVIDALERLHIPIKAVVNAVVYEDWQAAILQYSDDPEVGWILRSTPTRKRDGSPVSVTAELYPWQVEHLKKPTITYWEFLVQAGTLCAFGIDIAEVGVQCAEMVARILQGEDVRSVKAEYPRKVSIALNRKTATDLGIIFPMDVLDLANVIYDDYEGKQVIRK